MQACTFFDIVLFKREMNKNILFFVFALFAAPGMSFGATCSRANLTRCLDSVCAINISSNPAARCQYCGTADAGDAPSGAMRSVSVGQSAKYTLTAKELKSAPTVPGQRYAWAAQECIKKLPGCTADDITDVYDVLIEQSCRAAGISAEFASLRATAAKTKSRASCNTDIRACVVADKNCGADFSACEQNADFDKFFSACSVQATGCDEFISSIRTDLLAARDTAIKNADVLIANIVASYQSEREKKLNAVQASCKSNSGRENCIKTVCERSMANKCAAGFESEKSMATQLCKFYDLACNVLK